MTYPEEIKRYQLYGDHVQLFFKNTGQRYNVSFKMPGGWTKERPTTGVTTILKVLNKSALLGWAASQAATKMVEQVSEYKGEITKAILNDFATLARAAHLEKRDEAAQRGTDIHAGIELFLKTGNISTEPIYEPFQAWFGEGGWKCLESERCIYSRELDYAGTFDAILLSPTGKQILCDFKTSKKSKWAPDGVYIEYFAQMGGYAKALHEESGEIPNDLMILNVHKETGEITPVRASSFGMSVIDAMQYFDCVHACWARHKHWDWKMKG